MCPQCDCHCDYWKLSDSCFLSKVTYIFDNLATVAFSIFIILWASAFLEIWERKQSILKLVLGTIIMRSLQHFIRKLNRWEWDLFDVEEEEEVRAEYITGVKSQRLNPLSQQVEPYLKPRDKAFRITLSAAIVLKMLTAVLGAVFSVIVFRMFLLKHMYKVITSSSTSAKVIYTPIWLF